MQIQIYDMDIIAIKEYAGKIEWVREWEDGGPSEVLLTQGTLTILGSVTPSVTHAFIREILVESSHLLSTVLDTGHRAPCVHQGYIVLEEDRR